MLVMRPLTTLPRSAAWIGRTLPVPCAAPTTRRFGGISRGTLVTQSFVQAQGEWMTTEFVFFEGKLIFDAPATPTGTLVFEKANASGLPEHADALRVPVRFAAAP